MVAPVSDSDTGVPPDVDESSGTGLARGALWNGTGLARAGAAVLTGTAPGS